MTAKEYLMQARFIEKAIFGQLREIEYWKGIAEDISNPGLEEHYNPNRPQDAYFTRCFEMIEEIQQDIEEKTCKLMRLRKEIESTIGLLDSLEEQEVLRCRYLSGMSWRQVEKALNVSRATIYRIHESALKNFPVPLKVETV